MQPDFNVEVYPDYATLTFYEMPSNLSFLEEVFRLLAESKILVDMISMVPPCSSSTTVTFSVLDKDIVKTVLLISSLHNSPGFIRPIIGIGHSKITVGGEKMRKSSGIAAKALRGLLSKQVEILLITTSESDISFLVPYGQSDLAYIELQNFFCPSHTKE